MSTNNITQEQLADAVRAMALYVPEITIKSTVAIVGAKASVLRQIGSGTLLAVADMRFVVTAAHVMRQAQKDQLTLGISGAAGGFFTALTGHCMVTGDGEPNENYDHHDIAVYLLDAHQISKLSSVEYVRLSNVSFNPDLSNCLFVITGFPGIWSTPLSDDEEVMKSKLLQYGTYPYTGSTSALEGYYPDHHFLMQASHSQMLDYAGNPATFRTRSGYPAQMNTDLGGISGCSVWLIGDTSIPITQWSKSASKLIGVETAVYRNRGAIKATRWKAVVSLLYHAFPALRPAIELHLTN